MNGLSIFHINTNLLNIKYQLKFFNFSEFKNSLLLFKQKKNKATPIKNRQPIKAMKLILAASGDKMVINEAINIPIKRTFFEPKCVDTTPAIIFKNI
jgi:hypothetical protein